MIVYLMRHGTAISHEDPACPPDSERSLTRKGIEKTREAAKGLREMGAKPEVFLTSPYLRAAETAEITAEVFGYPIGEIRHVDALRVGATPSAIFVELAKLKVGEAICFGHAPTLDEAVAYAVGARSPFTLLKKAGVAALELGEVSPPKGILVGYYSPRALREMAG